MNKSLRVDSVVKEHKELIGSTYVHAECVLSVGDIISGQYGYVVCKPLVEIVGLGVAPNEGPGKCEVGIHSVPAGGNIEQVDSDP